MGDISYHDLMHYKNAYKLTTFFETGTFRGDGIYHALKVFDDVRSVDIEERHWKNAIQKYVRGHNRVHLYLGPSHEIMEKVLPEIDTNILFWLDAHFPGADDGIKSYDEERDMTKRIPLKSELEVIKKLRNGKDVIIIDDLWMYDTSRRYEWGTLDEHMISIGSNLTRKDMVGDVDDKFIYDLFSETHNIKIDIKHQGYAILTPKE